MSFQIDSGEQPRVLAILENFTGWEREADWKDLDFQLTRGKDKSVDFIPRLIDDNSGVGTQVVATDINGDGLPDIVVGNKKGTFVHLHQKMSGPG